MILLAIDDVTERRQGERRRAELLALSEEAVQRAARADAAKDLFLAALSHELRSPLTAILLHAQALQKGGLDPATVVRAGATIVAATRRQTRLVEDLLDVSRIVSGKIALAVEELDWRALVLSVIEAMRPEAEGRSVQLAVACEGEPPVCVGDPERLQQVVTNLIANAVKFTPGGGRVDVRVDAVDGKARLVVSDTGQGIAPEFLPHVFERFAQEPGATSFRGGLGLGLALVHELVKLHGGTVAAESPGRSLGATFTVMLPRVEAAERTAG
jgi:two-component system CheB/CheR fusion protein